VIEGRLGAGGSGDVFRVRHEITGRVEALKVLYAQENDERAQRILREAKIQAQLDHPNITALHNAFWWNGDLALVMELVDGRSLRQLMEDQLVDWDRALSIVRQVLRALEHAHSKGVVHRDISPANILITAQGRVKLTDFGLAKHPGDRRITQTGQMMGSVYYSSPEQIRSSGDVDFRTDIYSCGVLFYELLTGHKPFEAESSFELMMAHAQMAPVPPSKTAKRFPAAMDAWLLKALEKDPAARYTSAGGFLASMELPRRVNQAAVAAAGTFAVLLAGFAGLSMTRGPQETAIPPPPLPSIAIVEPPFPRPPLVVSTPVLPVVAPVVTEPVPAPSPPKGIDGKPLAAKTPTEPRHPDVEDNLSAYVKETPVPTTSVSPAAEAPVVEKRKLPPETVAEEWDKPVSRPGFVRGMMRRVNPFRKR
jgi:serine/threonine-protein kinase